MGYNPNIPHDINNPRFARQVADSSRQMWDRYYELEKRISSLTKQIDNQPQSNNNLSTQPIQLVEHNVQSFQGQLNQPQLAGIPNYSTLPATSMIGVDPNLQDTSMLRVGNLIYVVDQPNRAFIAIGLGQLAFTSYNTTTANANVTTKQFLKQTSLSGGYLNSLGRVLRIEEEGVYTTQAGQTPTFTFVLGLDGSGVPIVLGTTLATWGATGATTAATTNGFWQIKAYLITTIIGATAKVEVWGELLWQPANIATAVANVYQFVGLSAAFDATTVHSLDLTVTISTQPGSPFNICDQRVRLIEVLGV